MNAELESIESKDFTILHNLIIIAIRKVYENNFRPEGVEFWYELLISYGALKNGVIRVNAELLLNFTTQEGENNFH